MLLPSAFLALIFV